VSLVEPKRIFATAQITGRCVGKVKVVGSRECLAIRSQYLHTTGQCSVSLVSGPDDNRSSASCPMTGLSPSQEWWPWIQSSDFDTDVTRVNIFAPFPPEVSPHVRIIMRKLSRRRRWRDHAADIARALARKYPTQQSLDVLNSQPGQFTTEVECLLYSLINRSGQAKAALLREALQKRADFGFTVKTILNAIKRHALHGGDTVDEIVESIYNHENLVGADSESEDEEDEKIQKSHSGSSCSLFPCGLSFSRPNPALL
jgi:hypothetical protein